MIVSFLYIGGTFGAAIGGTCCDFFGRRKCILLTDLFFVLGGLILYLAGGFKTVLVGRLIVGFAIAVSGVADVS